MSALVNAGIGAVGALLGAWATDSERRHGARHFERPRLATAWLVCATIACGWGAVGYPDTALWVRVLLVALVPFGANGARQAWAQAWDEAGARAASRKAGDR